MGEVLLRWLCLPLFCFSFNIEAKDCLLSKAPDFFHYRKEVPHTSMYFRGQLMVIGLFVWNESCICTFRESIGDKAHKLLFCKLL